MKERQKRKCGVSGGGVWCNGGSEGDCLWCLNVTKSMEYVGWKYFLLVGPVEGW